MCCVPVGFGPHGRPEGTFATPYSSNPGLATIALGTGEDTDDGEGINADGSSGGCACRCASVAVPSMTDTFISTELGANTDVYYSGYYNPDLGDSLVQDAEESPEDKLQDRFTDKLVEALSSTFALFEGDEKTE